MLMPPRFRFLPLSIISFCLLAFVPFAAAEVPNDGCDLPQDLRREVASEYPGAKIVTLSDLNGDDRGFFDQKNELIRTEPCDSLRGSEVDDLMVG